MKIKFNKKQKKGMLISFIVIGVTGAFILSKFSGGSGQTVSPEETSVASQNVSTNITQTGPDVESLIDNTSPIARSAREAEDREAQETRETGESYIGNIFLNERTADSIIDVPRYAEPKAEPEPDLEPEAVITPNVPGVSNQQTNNGEKRFAEITLEDIKNVSTNSQVSISSIMSSSNNNQRLAGGMTVFAEYDKNESDGSNNGFEDEIANNSAPELYEASSPTYMNNMQAKTSETLKVTLGSKYYSTIGFSINSDDGGPALAQIHEGPLAGAKLQGNYVLNELAKAVNIMFNKMSLNGETYDINAIAYDLETDRPVLVDSVNNRRFERYGGLFLSAFIAGYADTLRDSTTNTTDNGNTITETSGIDDQQDRIAYALSEPARIISQELRANINRPITVYVSNGKGAGVYFLDDVEIQK